MKTKQETLKEIDFDMINTFVRGVIQPKIDSWNEGMAPMQRLGVYYSDRSEKNISNYFDEIANTQLGTLCKAKKITNPKKLTPFVCTLQLDTDEIRQIISGAESSDQIVSDLLETALEYFKVLKLERNIKNNYFIKYETALLHTEIKFNVRLIFTPSSDMQKAD